MAAEGYVQVAADGAGKKVETTELLRPDEGASATAAWRTVERQRVEIGDDPDILQRQTRLLHEILVELQQLRLALLNALH